MVMLGSRSFYKPVPSDATYSVTYCLIKGKGSNPVVEHMLNSGFIEEWGPSSQ